MNQVRVILSHDHQALDALLTQLAEEAQDSDRHALRKTWCDFEKRLLAHIDAEERYLLPLLEAQSPVQVAHARDEHARIRDLVAELGLAIELHAAREPAVRRLVELLRAHAQHEDSTLYQLAADKATLSVEHGISSALKAAVRSALRITGQETPSARQAVTRARSRGF